MANNKQIAKNFIIGFQNNMIELTKPQIILYKPDDSRKLCNMTIQHKVFGDITATTTKNSSGLNAFITEIKNKFGKSLGFEVFSLEGQDKNIFGYNISVDMDYRRKNLRLGEILRLSSIIEMFENKAPKINIYSKDSAVYFHSKYKFKPDLKVFTERDNALNTISKDKSKGFEFYREKAQEFIRKIHENQNNSEFQRQVCKDCNSFVQDYIQKAMQDDYKLHKFNYGMGMSLTADDVKANKDFFNELYRNHKINYRI